MSAVVAVLSSIASWMIKTFGVAGCALAIVLVYYNGLPFLNRYPWLANVPVIGQFAVGHVETYAVDQVKLATAKQTAICDAKLEKLVSGTELAAATARADYLQQQLTRAQALREQADKQAADLDTQAQEAQNALDQKLAADRGGDDRARWSASDIMWIDSQFPRSGK